MYLRTYLALRSLVTTHGDAPARGPDVLNPRGGQASLRKSGAHRGPGDADMRTVTVGKESGHNLNLMSMMRDEPEGTPGLTPASPRAWRGGQRSRRASRSVRSLMESGI